MKPDVSHESEEGIPAKDFASEEAADEANFGNWPDLFGLVLVAAITWMILTVTG